MSGMERYERTFFCPDMNTQAFALQVRDALYNTPGVLECDVSLPKRTVHVTLLDREGESTIRRHLSSVGFPPED